MITKVFPLQQLKYHFYSSIQNNSTASFTNCNNETFDVSFITQTSIDRLFFFKYLLERWHGPMSVTIYISNNSMEITEFEKSKISLPTQSIFRYSVFYSNSDVYSYNQLRNIAINNSITSHIYISDMDFWPSNNLYESFMSLSKNYLRDDWLAIIVPAFQYYATINETQMEPYVTQIHSSIPQTKDELKICIRKKKCSICREKIKTHNYVYKEWFNQPITRNISMIQCFNNDIQEPYVIVKKSDHLPIFPEEFSHGRDKIVWIKHILYIGYKFGELNQAYGIDIPHPDSEKTAQWRMNRTLSIEAKVNALSLYNNYMDILKHQPDRTVVYNCI